MKRKISPIMEDLIVFGIMFLVVLMVVMYQKSNPIQYQMFTTEGISYEKGKVTKVLSETLELEEGESGRFRGVQNLEVTLKTGKQKGQQIEIKNELSATHNINATEGTNIIIKLDAPEGITPFYTVFNYDRNTGIYLMIGIFLLLMLVVGGRKGIKSVIGLVFTLFFIIGFLLPAIYHGNSPVGTGILTVLVCSLFSLLLLNGFCKKTWTALAAVFVGVLISAGCYYLFSAILHLSGYNLDQAEELIIIHQNTGLQVSQILFVGILVASLGAILDMTMSVASSLFEMKRMHPHMERKDIFIAGMEIGKDMIGTMCETLILAFTGSAITALLVLISYGAQFQQILNSDYIANELLHSITGSVGVILTVPITAFFASIALDSIHSSKKSQF